MRYFSCDICRKEKVAQSDMSIHRACICEICRTEYPLVTKDHDDRRWEGYISTSQDGSGRI